jgi:DNA-binding response OmpR family regulator
MLRRESHQTEEEEGSARILIVDDDAGIRTVLEEALRRGHYQVQCAPDGLWVSRALRADAFSFDLVLLDWKMPGLDGLAVLQELHTLAPETPVLLISVAADDQLRLEALSLGAFEVLRKPIDFSTLASLVEKGLQRRRRRECTNDERTCKREEVITVSKHRGSGKSGKRKKGQPTQTPSPQAPTGNTSPQR